MVELTAEKEGIIRARHSKFRHVQQLADWGVQISDTGDGGTDVIAVDEEAMSAGKKGIIQGWLMADLWKLDSLPLEAGGYLAQTVIVERAQKLDIGSHALIRDALHDLEKQGRLETAKGKNLGLGGIKKYWKRRKDTLDLGAKGLPFEP